MERRHFLALLGGAAATAASPAIAATETSGSLFLSASGATDGAYAAAAIHADGRPAWRHPVPARGHHIAVHPGGRLCAVADRKPGRELVILDPRNGSLVRSIAIANGRHFEGHALFTADGAYLIATEGDDATEAGTLGVYRLSDGGLERRIDSFGMEPHQLLWDASGEILIVANGGVIEGSETAEIEFSIAVIRARDGALLHRATLDTASDPDLVTLSLRHMARAGDGSVVFGMQDQDVGFAFRPLIGIMAPNGLISLLDLPRALLDRMQGYVGSVTVDGSGRIAGVTSPRGGLAAFWLLADRRFIGSVDLADGCGLAPTGTPGGFLLTSGHGAVLAVDASGAGVTSQQLIAAGTDQPKWDNHLTAVT